MNEKKADIQRGTDNEKMVAVMKERRASVSDLLRHTVQELRQQRDEMIRERELLINQAELLNEAAIEINQFLDSKWSAHETDKANKEAEDKDPTEVPYMGR